MSVVRPHAALIALCVFALGCVSDPILVDASVVDNIDAPTPDALPDAGAQTMDGD